MNMDFSNGMSLSFAPASREDEIMQDIFVVLNTTKGEVPYYREFGVDGSYLHKPIVTARTMYAEAVTEAVDKFVPGVHVRKVTFNDNTEDPASLVPVLEVDIDE